MLSFVGADLRRVADLGAGTGLMGPLNTLPHMTIHYHTSPYITIHYHTLPYITIHDHTSPYVR